jgi:hypothetical protein
MYCECCGRDYLKGSPDCRCEFNMRCSTCRACRQHCGCSKHDAAYGGKDQQPDNRWVRSVDGKWKKA